MKTAVVTDTNSGISQQEAEKMGIFVLPMPVIIDGEIRYEGIDLEQEEFYASLTGGKNVSTSQPSPGDVMELWDRVLSQGYDELVHIPMSSGLSNSCETAIGLSKEYGGRVQVADNHRISVTMRQSVAEAKRLADAGMSAAQIREKLEKESYDATIYIAVDTLEFLKKGGRVTAAGAALGSVLNIKPVLTIQGGKLDAFAKVRGMKKSKAKMLEALQEDRASRFKNVDSSRLMVAAAGAGLSREDAQEWTQALAETFPGAQVYYDPLSFSVGVHTGPGAIGVGMVMMN